jgi:hypothetical protein
MAECKNCNWHKHEGWADATQGYEYCLCLNGQFISDVYKHVPILEKAGDYESRRGHIYGIYVYTYRQIKGNYGEMYYYVSVDKEGVLC